MNKLLLVLGAVLLAFFWLGQSEKTPDLDPRVGAPTTALDKEPIQTTLSSSQSYRLKDYTVYPQAELHMTARLLGKERYRFDKESDISPIDLALAWGPMANPDVLSQLNISQSGRWVRWRTSSLPLPRKEIDGNIANVHIIPANSRIMDKIGDLKSGDVVRLSGQLVNVHGDSGLRWNSSLSRTDTGNGACELLVLTNIEPATDPYY